MICCMNLRASNWIIGGVVAGCINGLFWFVYSISDSILGSIGITAAIAIGTLGFLYRLGKQTRNKGKRKRHKR